MSYEIRGVPNAAKRRSAQKTRASRRGSGVAREVRRGAEIKQRFAKRDEGPGSLLSIPVTYASFQGPGASCRAGNDGGRDCMARTESCEAEGEPKPKKKINREWELKLQKQQHPKQLSFTIRKQQQQQQLKAAGYDAEWNLSSSLRTNGAISKRKSSEEVRRLSGALLLWTCKAFRPQDSMVHSSSRVHREGVHCAETRKIKQQQHHNRNRYIK